MPQSELADLIDLIYAAALAEGASWPEVARQIVTLTGAQQASLVLPAANGREHNVFLEPGTYDERVRHYYRDISPWRVEAENAIRSGFAPIGRVVRGEDIVPDREFLNSEFYNDFGRHAGFRHMIGGLLSAETAVSIAFTRDVAAGPFDERDRHTLQSLMPHLQRALQLRKRFEPDASRLGAGALDALSIAVMVVDGNMRVKLANAAAVALTNGVCGMTVSRAGPDLSPGILADDEDIGAVGVTLDRGKGNHSLAGQGIQQQTDVDKLTREQCFAVVIENRFEFCCPGGDISLVVHAGQLTGCQSF